MFYDHIHPLSLSTLPEEHKNACLPNFMPSFKYIISCLINVANMHINVGHLLGHRHPASNQNSKEK